MLSMLKPEDMDGSFGKTYLETYLDHLEFTAQQIQADDHFSQESQETWAMIFRVKGKLAECLRQRRQANRCQLLKSLACEEWQLDEMMEKDPSMDLRTPDEFILYWYVYGYFPNDMSLEDMGRTRQAVQHQLNQLICCRETAGAFEAYCRRRLEAQLRQLQIMIDEIFRQDFTKEVPKDTEDFLTWQDDEGEDEEEAFEHPDGGPIYLAFIPGEPEHPEDMTIPELSLEIEKQEFNLYCLKSVENGEEGTEKPFLWYSSVESVRELLSRLRGLLRQRLLEVLGVEAEEASAPTEFQDGDLPILYGGDELVRPEDIAASWYLSNSFPLITSCEKMQQVEAELKRQQTALEAEEPALENEAEHALWQFCLEQRAVQLDEIQTMMWNQATDWGEWDLEEDSADE